MKWTNKKPNKIGLYWWKKYKKSKVYLVEIEEWQMADKKFFVAEPIDIKITFKENGREEDMPFESFEELKNINGYFSDSSIPRPKS